MRAYCRLTDAELAISDLAKARRYAELSLPLVNAFSPTSPDLKILNAVGSCYESLGNVQRFIALDQSVSTVNRQAAETEARRWYQKSFDLWTEWNWRGTATPESEAERRKIDRLLSTPGYGERKLRTSDKVSKRSRVTRFRRDDDRNL